MREVAVALLAAEVLLGDFVKAEDALEWSRKLEHAVEHDETWADGRHSGDCTQEPFTCSRCLIEEYEGKARELAQKEGMFFGT